VQDIVDGAVKKVDLGRTQTLTQFNEMIVAAAYADGDVLVVVPTDKKRKGIQTYLDVIEASRIKTRPKDAKNILVREGVEYYADGRLKGYWVIKPKRYNKPLTYHTAKNTDFEFFPVFKESGSLNRRVAWMFSAVTTKRPAQSRQVPVLTASMELLRYYGKYFEAVLVGARVAACFSAFVKTTNPSNAQKALGDEVNPRTGRRLSKLQPGLISYLRPNESIEFASPNKPSDNFDKFILRMQRVYSMQQQMPYEILFLDLAETNYSSWRGGNLKVEQNIGRWQGETTNITDWYLRTIIGEAVTKNLVDGSIKGLRLKVRYPKFKTLDEEKTERANKTRLGNETSSKQMITDEQGTDWIDLQQELDDEMVVDTTREAKRLKLQKDFEEELDITFLDTPQESDGESQNDARDGEKPEKDGSVSEDDKKERRKTDGNF
jgi:capsid protein